jgi:acyl dehydratase
MRYLEDFQRGAELTAGPYLITEEAVLRFAAEFDPLPIHVDKEKAEASSFKGLLASGLQTLSIATRLMHDCFTSDAAVVCGQGMHHVIWSRPVRPRDQLDLLATIVDASKSLSRPGCGSLGVDVCLRNQSKEAVLRCRVDYLMLTRPIETDSKP